MKNEIPPITDPMGRHWYQPKLTGILMDDTHCILTQDQFDRLPEYSASIPSGVYPGKAWKRNDGAFDEAFRAAGGKLRWLLGWYGETDDPEKCSINWREVLIA